MARLKWFVFAILLASVACTRTARLYPVAPINASAPVIVGKIHGAFSAGTVSFTLPDGEVCKGHWTLVPLPNSTGKNAPSELGPVWDQVYGSGYYLAHVVGTRLYARAAAVGNRGTTLYIEFHQSATAVAPNTNTVASIKGVAKDNSNNIFKLTFD
jgi:hypothetical protein